MDKSQQIIEWLRSRGISQEVINESGIEWNGYSIAIPVYDKDKNFLFFKYRKDPANKDELVPKYTYEKGSTASLYNVHTVKDIHHEVIFICEGEMDALRLNSLGLRAVSSTGGSQTFRPEWLLDFLNNQVYICYDKDDAGIRGALRVNTMLASAKIIFLPEDTKGKDVTDYLKTHTLEQFLSLVKEAESWIIPLDPKEVPPKKSTIDCIIKSFNDEMDSLLERKHRLTANKKQTRHIDIMIDVISARVENWKKHRKMMGRKIPGGLHMDDIALAKTVPISNYIKFNGGGFAKCLWHIEKTASMKYRPERNKVYCHGCAAHKDTIDVVMAQQKVDFNTALRLILGKPLQG